MSRKTHKDPVLIKKEILEYLAKGYGIMETMKLVRVGRTTYYNWRKKDPEWAADLDRILADPLHATRILRQESKAELGIEADWKLRFLGVYRRTGDRNAALQACGEGKRAQDVENALDPTHESYDEDFAKAFMNEEQKRLWTIEDNTLKKAEHDAPTARFVLSNLVKEKYGKLEGTTTIQQAWFTSRGESKALEDLQGLNFGKATEPEPRRRADGPTKEISEVGGSTP